MKAKYILSLILTLVIAGILIGYVFPIGMNAMNETNTDTYTMSAGDTVNVTNDVTAYLININTSASPTTLNMTVNDTDNGDSYSIDDLAEGDSVTLETEQGDLEVAFASEDSGDAEVEFTYANEFGWSGASRNIYGILGIFLILILLIMVTTLVFKAVM